MVFPIKEPELQCLLSCSKPSLTSATLALDGQGVQLRTTVLLIPATPNAQTNSLRV